MTMYVKVGEDRCEKRSRTGLSETVSTGPFFIHVDKNCFYSWNRLEFYPMDDIFRRLIANNFSDLAGLRVDASIPVPEHIVNEIIKAVLRGNKTIKNCRVSVGGQNKVSVNFKTPFWPWPINLKLKLERSVDFTGSPKIRASLENNALFGKLGALFKVLPEGVNIHGDHLIVDAQSFLTMPEQRKMLDLIKSVEVRTESGKVIFDIKLEVEQFTL